MNTQLLQVIGITVSLVVPIIGALWSLRKDGKIQDELQGINKKLQEQPGIDKELIARTRVLELIIQKRFLEVRLLIRRSVALICILVGVLVLVLMTTR